MRRPHIALVLVRVLAGLMLAGAAQALEVFKSAGAS